MRITKFVHSCLLVETPKITVLIDPGGFTWESHLLDVNRLPTLDHIIITHEHPDHYNEQLLRKLSKRFPHTPIITNEDLAAKIAKLKLPNALETGSQENLQVFEIKHEPITFNRPVPKQVGVHVADRLTHAGDSVHVRHTREIIALPVTAPWVSHKQSLEELVKTDAKVVIPVHDWFWHKEAREYMYDQSRMLLEPKGIKFLSPENAEPIEV